MWHSSKYLSILAYKVNCRLNYFPAYRDDWEAFISSFDYIRDLAVEEPGDSPFITARKKVPHPILLAEGI